MPPSSTVVTLVWLLSIFEWPSCRCGGSLTFIRTCRFLIFILTSVLSICDTGNSCISLLWFCSGKGRGFNDCCKLVYILLQVFNSSILRSSHRRFYLQGGQLHFSEFFLFCIQCLHSRVHCTSSQPFCSRIGWSLGDPDAYHGTVSLLVYSFHMSLGSSPSIT